MSLVTRLNDYQTWLDEKKDIADFLADIMGARTCERAANRIDDLEGFLKYISEKEGAGGGLFAGDLQLEIKQFLEKTS